MKKLNLLITAIVAVLITSSVFSQTTIKDSLGLPGDNFNLYAVMDVFQQSKTLEEFEGKINSKDTKINNLDLNNDGKIDYIKVIDNVQGTSHAIVLQDEINEKELQDIAVIEVDKNKDGSIKTQIVGDEQLYGKNYIVEPKDEQNANSSQGTPNPGYKQGTTIINNTTNNYYDNDSYYNTGYSRGYYRPISHWYIWDYIYAPTYVVYVSPWHWGYYPTYWNPWIPWFWHEYYGFHYHHYGYFHRSYVYAAPVAHGFYGLRRTASVYVGRSAQSGVYRTTYGRRDLLNKSLNENRVVNREREQRERNNNRIQQNNNQRNTNRIEPLNNERKNQMQPSNKDGHRNNHQQIQNNNRNKNPNHSPRMSPAHNPKSSPSHISAPRSTPHTGGGKRK